MKKLYCPWRSKYIEGVKEEKGKSECVFCNKIKSQKLDEHYILYKTKHSVVMLNLYPYNAGHLLIIPVKHCSDISLLSKPSRQDLMEKINECTQILQKSLECQGVNIGINLGKAAGAGIPEHFHIHILPRWEGDTNFMPTLADTKQISCDLNDIYKKLKPEFDKLKK